MSHITADKICVFIGKRNTGKSWAVRDLLYHLQHIPTGIVISGTERANKFYSNHIPEIYIHDDYDSNAIHNVIKKQQNALETGKKNFETFIVLDDLTFDKSWVKDKNISEIFMNGRHYHILFVLTMQYPLAIPPALRSNVDYVFIFRENFISNRRRIWEHYCGVIPKFDQFQEIMDVCTKDYGCLVIDNSKTSTSIDDVVSWYKAEPRYNFKVGGRKYWKRWLAYKDTWERNKKYRLRHSQENGVIKLDENDERERERKRDKDRSRNRKRTEGFAVGNSQIYFWKYSLFWEILRKKTWWNCSQSKESCEQRQTV